MSDKREQMLKFWSDRANLYGFDPRANTNDVWLRSLEIDAVNNLIKAKNVKNALDFGCANGYSTNWLAKNNPGCKFLGVDINFDMIQVANDQVQKDKLTNLTFQQIDILTQNLQSKYDFIFAIRVFQNIENPEKQLRIFDKLLSHLDKGGFFFFIESYSDGYTQLNSDRSKIGLPPLPIHPHLTLLTEEFDAYVSEKMDLLEQSSPSSSYYLITRLLYSYLAQIKNEPIDYNHEIHWIATLVPQIGNYGPQKAMLLRKK